MLSVEKLHMTLDIPRKLHSIKWCRSGLILLLLIAFAEYKVKDAVHFEIVNVVAVAVALQIIKFKCKVSKLLQKIFMLWNIEQKATKLFKTLSLNFESSHASSKVHEFWFISPSYLYLQTTLLYYNYSIRAVVIFHISFSHLNHVFW